MSYRPDIDVIVPAAGSSARMGSPSSKLLLPLGRESVLQRTIRILREHPAVGTIVVAIRESDREEFSRQLEKYEVVFVEGGSSRQLSVRNGLRALAAASNGKYVAIHDGARCFITQELLDRVFKGVREHDAVTLACRVVDTLVRSADGIQREGVPREHTWAIQTPQVFRADLCHGAHDERAHEEGALEASGASATDDASLVQALHPITLIEGAATNLKITTRSDYELAVQLERALRLSSVRPERERENESPSKASATPDGSFALTAS